MIHTKKILPEYFDAVTSGKKLFEIREEDKSACFLVGDFLALNEFKAGSYTGRCCLTEIVYTLRDPEYVPEGKCIMGIHPCRIGTMSDTFVGFCGNPLEAPVYASVGVMTKEEKHG